MIHKWKFRRGFLLFPVFLFLVCSSFAEHPDSTLYKTYKRYSFFCTSSKFLNVDLGLLMAIVYVERISNFDWKDKALDILLANSGYNSSIGFCQVKLKTAYWIEVQLNDSSSIYWPGKEYANILSVSQSPKELIAKLENDSLNITYAAAYLRIIESRWEKAGYPIDDRADIIGTLYSTGLFNPDKCLKNFHPRITLINTD
jgi:hypothetical protein